MLRVIALAMLCCVALAGCTTAPETGGSALAATNPAPAGPPRDFSVDLAILAGSAVNQPKQVVMRQSRYVLLPDGSLCYGADPDRGKGADWLPPITRILTTDQISKVWSAAREAGFTDPARADETMNFKLVVPPANTEVVYLLELAGRERRWNFIRRCSMERPIDPALARFIEALARLAWADEQSPEDTPIAPKRYDFGPDPYSRYRKE